MHDHLRMRLLQEVEGKCTGRYGYVVTVMEIRDISRGVILPCHGLAEFHIKYNACVCKPFKGEVLDAEVTAVNKMGFYVAIGPVDGFISTHVRHCGVR
jgi:DNA-directed RNA polymerase II subunit RPB7